MSGFKVRENEDGEMVLTKEYYEELLDDQRVCNALHNAGVDNWEWYEDALEDID